MAPEHGLRLSLRLKAEDGVSVVYAAELELPGERLQGQAAVQLAEGLVHLSGLDAAPPWALEFTRLLLRGQWRQRERGWPRRLTRWREAPAR